MELPGTPQRRLPTYPRIRRLFPSEVAKLHPPLVTSHQPRRTPLAGHDIKIVDFYLLRPSLRPFCFCFLPSGPFSVLYSPLQIRVWKVLRPLTAQVRGVHGAWVNVEPGHDRPKDEFLKQRLEYGCVFTFPLSLSDYIFREAPFSDCLVLGRIKAPRQSPPGLD